MHINAIDPAQVPVARAERAIPGLTGVESIYIIANFYSSSCLICAKFFTLPGARWIAARAWTVSLLPAPSATGISVAKCKTRGEAIVAE